MTDLGLTFYRGRVALYHILMELGVGAGDRVLCPAFTCSAVPEAILSAGAIPVWIDVEANGVTICPTALAREMQIGSAKAVLVQSTFAVPPDPHVWKTLARTPDVPVIEDMCHSAIGRWNGPDDLPNRHFAFYSFEWGKPIIGGVGGSAVEVGGSPIEVKVETPPRSAELKVAVQGAFHAALYRPSTYWHMKKAFSRAVSTGVAVGNYNPTPADGTVGEEYGWDMPAVAKARAGLRLRRLDALEARALENASVYADIVGPAISHDRLTAETVLSRYPVLVADRAEVLAMAESERVELASWYSTPVHPLEGDDLRAVQYMEGSCPNAEDVVDRIVSLPLWSRLSSRYLDRVRSVF